MGMCVYLFFEVRASPAAAQAQRSAVASKEPPATDERDDADHTEPPPRRLAGAAGLRQITQAATHDAAPAPTSSPSIAPATPEADDPKLTGPKLDAVMAEANKAYDKMEFEEARSIAQRVLKQYPNNIRMLRIMTSSHCIEADAAEAQKYFNQLPPPDREQMKTRCARYGVTFTEPPAR